MILIIIVYNSKQNVKYIIKSKYAAFVIQILVVINHVKLESIYIWNFIENCNHWSNIFYIIIHITRLFLTPLLQLLKNDKIHLDTNLTLETSYQFTTTTITHAPTGGIEKKSW